MLLALLSRDLSFAATPRMCPSFIRWLSTSRDSPAKKRRSWTEDEAQTVLDGVLADMTNKEIVQTLVRRSPGSLDTFMHKLAWDRCPSDWAQAETDIVDSCIARRNTARQVIDSLPHRDAISTIAYTLQRTTKSNTVPWSAAEDEVIRRGIGDGLSFRETMLRLPGRTSYQIGARTAYLGLKWPQTTWTNDQTSKLRHCVEDGQSIENMLDVFHDKSAEQIRWKMFHLGLARSNRFTSSEIAIVKQGIDEGLYNDEIAALLPGRSMLSVKALRRRRDQFQRGSAKTRTQFIKEDGDQNDSVRHRQFSDEDINLLKECSAKKMTLNSICELFPKRTFDAVKAKLARLRLPYGSTTQGRAVPWSALENELLLKHRLGGVRSLQKYLDRTPASITMRLRRMQEEESANHDVNWTAEDTQKSRAWLEDGVKVRDIAKRLQKGYSLVWDRLYKLGLCGSRSKSSEQ